MGGKDNLFKVTPDCQQNQDALMEWPQSDDFDAYIYGPVYLLIKCHLRCLAQVLSWLNTFDEYTHVGKDRIYLRRLWSLPSSSFQPGFMIGNYNYMPGFKTWHLYVPVAREMEIWVVVSLLSNLGHLLEEVDRCYKVLGNKSPRYLG